MRKSNLNIDATLEVILCILKHFEGMPDDEKKQKTFLKLLSNLKLRLKLLVNDVYGDMIIKQGFAPGISKGVQSANGKIIWEHTIPWEVFFPYLVKKKFKTIQDLDFYLKYNFCQCKISKDEDGKLNNAKLKSSMPKNWKKWNDRYKYQGVNIKLASLPVNPSNPLLNIGIDTL